ncbi:MAG TPA: hypothetical protein VFB13_17895 [Reyranella sp.]|jgi:hypothetical protein|nr:hypothetical protein [Reyranella sp.]
MAAAYRLAPSGVVRASDGAFIPADLANADWGRYQAWLAVPNTPDPVPAAAPKDTFNLAIAAGLAVTSSGTPALNATYALDRDALFNITSEQVYIATKGTFTNGGATRAWLDAAGTPHVFPSVAAFTAFAEAVAQYVDSLNTALVTAEQGGTPAWPAAAASIP